ncbi:Lipoprotein-anchoring transpeptidase ErfK/SrfK [Frankineae bacterium MT45]|nr:Lipoprotein-anchoring transpeptidase ErfK/SrfK [Frankineae bacterium MT45]
MVAVRRWRRSALSATALVMGAIIATTALTACNPKSTTVGAPSAGQSPAGDADVPSATPTPTATPAPSNTPAALALSPANGAANVSPVAPVTASVTGGKLTAVTVTNDAGKEVTGALDPTSATWKATEPLGYSRTYRMKADAVNDAGSVTTQTSSFTTLTPGNMTQVYLNTTGGQPLNQGGVYGVGIVVVAHFDEQITDRAAAEKALVVTTTPAVAGSWYWTDNSNAHWRPQTYYASGTKVSVNANIYGVKVGPGLYGETDSAVGFTIGAKHVSISDDKTKMVSVYFNDKLQRKMPTSMGKGGSQVVNGLTISYWTQPGTYTVIGQGNPVIMDSSTYGLPVNAKGGYREPIYWATRISTDGVYLHELDTTVWAQGSRDLSHGCLNLNQTNAKWFYQNAQIGDVVKVINTGGSTLQVWQNGDWTVPWATWKAGSALS